MTILFIDAETFYDQEYSLNHLDPPSYILDARFELIGCAVRTEGEERSRFIDGPEFAAYLGGLDPATTTTVAFNAMFDNCILAYRYNFVPARIMCTMRMAVALRGHELQGHSLAAVGERLGVGVKGNEIVLAKGKRRADMMADPYFWRAYREYACNDNDMNYRIFRLLAEELPVSEWKVMDRVMRCAMEPKFMVDKEMLAAHLKELDEIQVAMLAKAGTDAKSLRSTKKFEKLLTERGVEIEYKPSYTDPTRQIPAFAKTDSFMAVLSEHPDPEVQALAAARLGVRSTIEQTRGKRMLDIANLAWPGYRDGNMPVPLKYAAAHTHRLGGDWKLNMQNLPAGRGGMTSKLRRALCAPPGHKVVVADKSQIECRIAAYICGQESLLQIFRARQDPYAELAGRIFRRAINKKVDVIERFIGKSGVLGLGYGCGHDRFYAMVIAQARTLGIDMAKLYEIWTPELALLTVRTYREMNQSIVQRWRWLDGVIATTWSHGTPQHMRFGPVLISKGCIEGPNGLRMQYADPRFDPETQNWRYTYDRRSYTMYGAKLLENIVQFLARINLMHDALRISDRGFPFVLQAHDELVWVVPDDQVEQCMNVALEEMRRPPSWASGIPLDAESSFGQNYGGAKA
jgi:DNA polymerase